MTKNTFVVDGENFVRSLGFIPTSINCACGHDSIEIDPNDFYNVNGSEWDNVLNKYIIKMRSLHGMCLDTPKFTLEGTKEVYEYNEDGSKKTRSYYICNDCINFEGKTEAEARFDTDDELVAHQKKSIEDYRNGLAAHAHGSSSVKQEDIYTTETVRVDIPVKPVQVEICEICGDYKIK